MTLECRSYSMKRNRKQAEPSRSDTPGNLRGASDLVWAAAPVEFPAASATFQGLIAKVGEQNTF
jgi:hypothetical protein